MEQPSPTTTAQSQRQIARILLLRMQAGHNGGWVYILVFWSLFSHLIKTRMRSRAFFSFFLCPSCCRRIPFPWLEIMIAFNSTFALKELEFKKDSCYVLAFEIRSTGTLVGSMGVA